MNIPNLVERQKLFEGFKPLPYKCTEDIWTVGYGSTVLYGERVTEFTPTLSRPQAETALKAHLLDAFWSCKQIYGLHWHLLTGTQQEVLVHMAYQLGRNGLLGFKNMNKAIFSEDITEWCAEMQDSRWWRRTPRPATACYNAIVHGDWQGEWQL